MPRSESGRGGAGQWGCRMPKTPFSNALSTAAPGPVGRKSRVYRVPAFPRLLAGVSVVTCAGRSTRLGWLRCPRQIFNLP